MSSQSGSGAEETARRRLPLKMPMVGGVVGGGGAVVGGVGAGGSCGGSGVDGN